MDTLQSPITTDRRHATARSRPRWGPAARPPVVIRLFTAVLGFGAILTTVALLLSDRAPGVLRAVFGDRARRLWARIDATEGLDAPARSELPPTDFLVHVSIWVVVATLVGLALWSWRGLAIASFLLLAASVLLELAQGRYSTTRAVEVRDAVANLLGIGIGVGVAAACYVAWSVVSGLGRRLRTP